MQELAAEIDEPDWRRSFLDRVPVNQAIAAAWRLGRPSTARLWQTVRLPSASAPTGRPLRNDEWVEVTWTIAAPEDDDFPDPAVQRRHRLLRLLRQAAEQSAAPTVAALADALGVATRTIKRDLAALRTEGHPVATRGHRL